MVGLSESPVLVNLSSNAFRGSLQELAAICGLEKVANGPLIALFKVSYESFEGVAFKVGDSR